MTNGQAPEPPARPHSISRDGIRRIATWMCFACAEIDDEGRQHPTYTVMEVMGDHPDSNCPECRAPAALLQVKHEHKAH